MVHEQDYGNHGQQVALTYGSAFTTSACTGFWDGGPTGQPHLAVTYASAAPGSDPPGPAIAGLADKASGPDIQSSWLSVIIRNKTS